jgi:hypothetical protein
MVTAFLLIASAVLWRVLNAYFLLAPNFAPLMALAFCSGLYATQRRGIWFAITALVLSDLLLNLHYGVALVSGYSLVSAAVYLIVALGARAWSDQRTLPVLVLGTAGSSLLFYVATNTGSWLTVPGYASTFSGWVQALTVGLPGYAPTWMFFRNSLLSDFLFTGLFVAAMELQNTRIRLNLFSRA